MRNFFNRYLDIALELIAHYDGKVPLSHYLKNYFAQHKKHGSKDRKWIGHFCYCYYRLGFALRAMDAKERLLVAIFLCGEKRGEWLSLFGEEWQNAYSENVAERGRFVQSLYAFSVANIFYKNVYLSHGIEAIAFDTSHLIQPNVFLRLRPGKEAVVKAKLQREEIAFTVVRENCLALESAIKVDSIIDLNKDAVVQDASSQEVASLFSLVKASKPITVWDCCAASGGKSILAYDYFTNVRLTVSDIRTSIIHNLKERFRQAGITEYQTFVADISSPQFISKQLYDLVICDVPCSGSGTWSRTPEQLYFFTEDKLTHYIELQKKITAAAIKAVKQNGYFLYITCSVFKQENEDILSHIQSISGFAILKAGVIKGYDKKADTMFAALFVRSND